MKNNRTYLYLQLKMIFQLLPKLIAGTIVLAVLVSAIAFCGTKLLYRQSSASKVNIAMVVEDTSSLMDFGMHYLESSESINTFCRLITVSEKEANQMLEEGKAAAIVHFPKYFSQDIVDGTNTPATITFSRKIGIEQLLFDELTNAASQIIGYAQSGIYSMGDIYGEYDFIDRKSVHYDYLNQQTLQTALLRSQLFQTKYTSSTNSLSVMEFYTISAVILLFFLSGMSLSRFAQPENQSLAKLLSLKGITAFWRTIWKSVALFLYYLVIGGFLFLCGALAKLLPWNCFLVLPCLALLCSSWTIFLFSITASETSGTLLTFFATFFCASCSGCLIPSAFLPKAINSLGHLFPTHYAHKLLCIQYTSSISLKEVLPLLLFVILLTFLSVVSALRTERRLS